MQITIGSVVITDNGPHDLDPAPDVIKFSSAPGPKTFALPAQCTVQSVRGVVKLDVNGTVVQMLPAGGQSSLVLTDFHAKGAPQGPAATQPLTVKFEHEFLRLGTKVTAAETLLGRMSELQGGSLNGSSVTWSAHVDGQRIQPPNAAFTLLNGPASGANVAIAPPPGGPMNVTGGPDWTLSGELVIVLNGRGHVLELPKSAEIGIVPVHDPREQRVET